MKYELINRNKFPVPVMLDDPSGEFTRVIIKPKQSIIIEKWQLSDSIKNLTSSPRFLLGMRTIKD